MKRNLMIILCVLAMLCSCLVSCNKDCEHELSANWLGDANGHWHPTTCEHGEFKSASESHVDVNQDGFCDVCTYEFGHEHTFAEEWQINEYYHWHDATCAHTEQQGSYELHSDGNVDSVCDYCGGHVHAMNIIGFCGSCEKKLKDVENADIAYVIYAAGITGYDKINGGKINYRFDGRSNTSADYETIILKSAEYSFGNGFTYNKIMSDSTNGGVNEKDTQEGWFQVDGSGVFGVISNDGGKNFEVVAASNDHLYGYYFALSNLADGHGAENILYSLFEVSQTGVTYDFEYTLDEAAGKASFSYKAVLVGTMTDDGVSVNYFDAKVSFTFTEMYSITSLDITLDCYTSDPGVSQSDGFLEADVDFDYDEVTGAITFRDNAKPDTYTVKVTQTLGERTAENKHPKSSFVPESFDIYYDAACTQPIGEHVSINVYDFFEIRLGNFQPEGTSVKYVQDCIKFEVLDENGNVLISSVGTVYEALQSFSCDRATGYFTYNASGRFFVFYPKAEGDYTYRLYLTSELTHEFTIHANKKTTTNVQVGENQFAVKVDTPYANGVSKVTFVAPTAGTYTFTFTDELSFVNADEYDAAFAADGSVIGDFTTYYDFQDPFGPKDYTFTITLKANETVRFYVTSDKAGTYVVSYSVK